jgi:hypothetical protein
MALFLCVITAILVCKNPGILYMGTYAQNTPVSLTHGESQDRMSKVSDHAAEKGGTLHRTQGS